MDIKDSKAQDPTAPFDDFQSRSVRTSDINPVKLEDASQSEITADWDAVEERKLVWKVDLRIFPMLCIIFGLSLLDRTNISSAYIAGLGPDLQLNVGDRYSIALLVFFIGYGIFELPSNMVIRRLGARLWLSFLIIVWGACVLGMGFVKSWVPLAVLRALLGVFEAGLFPGAIFIIGSWYKQWETARRVSMFYMAALLASGFGPILAYAFSLIRVGGPSSMFQEGWRWIFIIEGIATIVAGIAAIFFLADFPESAKWLSLRERHIALYRVQIDQGQREKVVHLTLKQSLRTLLDWKLGVYCIQYFICASGVYSIAFFQPIILMQGMGFDYAKSQLLSSPPYIAAILLSVAMAWVSDKFHTRWPVLCFQAVTGIVGLAVVAFAKPPGVRYFGLFLAVFGCQANVPGTLAYAQSQTPRIEKRGIVSAAMISIGAVGGVAGSTIFRSKDAPQYLPGMAATIGMQALYAVMTFSMSMYLKRQNKLADEGKKPMLEGVEGFRYAI